MCTAGEAYGGRWAGTNSRGSLPSCPSEPELYHLEKGETTTGRGRTHLQAAENLSEEAGREVGVVLAAHHHLDGILVVLITQ